MVAGFKIFILNFLFFSFFSLFSDICCFLRLLCYNLFMNEINIFLQEKQLSTISTTVPDRLDYLMRLHSMTNIALSEIMCCAESTISGYRTGRRVPDIFVICNLSTIFGVTPNYFLGFTDEICPTHN